ncbi:MAG: sugar ABC transporter ATP-binding protein [Eubacteriales bacterium]
MENSEQKKPILSVRGLKKAFSGKTVVDNVSFDIYPGEVVALCGENGAGKSTFKNMVCGLLKPTAGEIYIDGVKVEKIHPAEHGIAAVHQELSLFKSLSIAANMSISNLPGNAVNVNWKEADEIARKQLEFMGLDEEPGTLVEKLSTGKQQIVEIGKAILQAEKLLILDEPTTSLTAPERQKLFEIMNNLRDQGMAIVFISHFMEEVMSMSDKYIVLRDGEQVGNGKIADITRGQLEAMMVGREISETIIDIGTPTEEEALRVENLNSADFVNVNFSVKKGEILGISGLVGAGRTEIVEAIFGVTKAEGDVYVMGEKVPKVTVEEMLNRKVAMVTEDRRNNGIFGVRSVRENITAASLHKVLKVKKPGLGFTGETDKAEEVIKEMKVALPHAEAKIKSLSGGNQQKVMIGRWLETEPDIIILDEPTKGVDIGAKFDIHNMVAELAKKGAAVILVSSDLPELFALSHRTLVVSNGHLVGEMAREEFSAVTMISLASKSVYEQ